MITVSKNLDRFLLALAIAVVTTGTAYSQSGTTGYGAYQTNGIRNLNSSSQFTSTRIQQQLQHRSVNNDRQYLSRITPPARQAARQNVSKPFSSVSRGPTVSPYLALSNSRNQVSDYYNIVRPQREQRSLNRQQQQFNQQLLRQNTANQHRLNEMAAAGPFDPKGSEDIAPTGHAAVHQSLGNYLNFGGYFPPPSEPKQR